MKKALCILLPFLALVTYSCSDLKKGEYLTAIEDMNKTIDSVETVLLENQIDTLPQLTVACMGVELRIKNNYYADTIDMELGKKMDAFKRMRKRLKPIAGTFNTIKLGVKDERETLKALKTDIENGNGDRKKYGEYVEFEQQKVNQLRSLIKDYVNEKDLAVKTLDELYDELNVFSLKLLEDPKNKIPKSK